MPGALGIKAQARKFAFLQWLIRGVYQSFTDVQVCHDSRGVRKPMLLRLLYTTTLDVPNLPLKLTNLYFLKTIIVLRSNASEDLVFNLRIIK